MINNTEGLENLDQFDGKYSIGTSVALSTLLGVLANPEQPYDILLLNVETILRNVFNMENPLEKQIRLTKEEYVNFIMELAHVSQSSQVGLRIIPYLSVYNKMLPVVSRKKATPKRNVMGSIVKRLLMDHTTFKPGQSGNVIIDPLMHKGSSLVVKELKSKLNKIGVKKKILMMSHIPLDFHLFKFYKQSNILESYTGNLINVDRKTLGKKVFGQEHVPFHEGTHPFFGDKYVVNCVLNRQDKKRVLANAAKNVWHLKSPYALQREIENSVGMAIPFKIF